MKLDPKNRDRTAPRARAPRALTLALCALAFALSLAGAARAQDAPQTGAARKIDEYGNIRHCDLTARLDNFAIELQNDPTLKGVLVAYDAKGKAQGRAANYMKVGRFYLVHDRGIDASRLVAVYGGVRDVEDVTTELWAVPEGAAPPVPPPAEDKYAAKDFRGMFDSYATDEQIYRVQMEMGHSAADIAQSEFADKLKQQPDSLGYLLIRTSKKSLRGTWRRIAGREQQIIQKDHGIAAGRLASVYKGRTEGDHAEVELWILPKSVPPPEGAREDEEKALTEAVRLNRLDAFGSADAEAENWMIENLAAALRENPKASVALVAREADMSPFEGGEGEAVEEAGAAAAEQPAAQKAPAGAQAATPAAEPTSAEDAQAEDEEQITAKERAERWKKILTTKYGIYSWRVTVLEGRKMTWSTTRLSAWLVPEKGRWPDPQALDEDEAEEADVEPSAAAEATAETAQAPPR